MISFSIRCVKELTSVARSRRGLIVIRNLNLLLGLLHSFDGFGDLLVDRRRASLVLLGFLRRLVLGLLLIALALAGLTALARLAALAALALGRLLAALALLA